MNYVEFRLSVPIFDLCDEHAEDCAEILSLHDELQIPRSGKSLRKQYSAYYDWASAIYAGDPTARAGRGDVHVFLAEADDQTFLSVNLFDEPTDQMNIVEIGIRCAESRAGRVETLLRAIRDRAEVAGALLSGNLGLREELELKKFPRLVDDRYSQHIRVFLGGLIQATSEWDENVDAPIRQKQWWQFWK